MSNISDINFYTKSCKKLTKKEIEDSSFLFSNNYGTYSSLALHNKAGRQIKLGRSYYEALSTRSDYFVSFAYLNDKLIGHSYYLLKNIAGRGKASWVIQLVVHKDFRNQAIGKQLLYSVWGFSNDLAWGLATSNPLTVKTLESATFRKVSKDEMNKNINLIKELASEVPFVNKEEIIINQNESITFTDFFVDHSEIETLITNYNSEWILGNLPEGFEWIAFTFQDQEIIPLDSEKINKLIEYSDKIIKQAYSRMSMPSQSWANHGEAEVNYIIKSLGCGDKNIAIADFGCGIGRHLNFFFKQGYKNIVGVDFSKTHIEYCKKTYPEISSKFIEGDCRTITFSEKFDLITCLYDVVGSFPDQLENEKIINNIKDHLNKDGYLVISVMNMELTKSLCKHEEDIYKEPLSLFKLKASNIMQRSGDVFDPDFFLIDINTGLVYRKEMFVNDNNISAEYLIRDKRYTKEEISSMLNKYGFEIISLSYVQAGRWGNALEPTNLKAKEILVFAKLKRD